MDKSVMVALERIAENKDWHQVVVNPSDVPDAFSIWYDDTKKQYYISHTTKKYRIICEPDGDTCPYEIDYMVTIDGRMCTARGERKVYAWADIEY